jgi:pimeloyl-ACP methyl ester carboxylesterase
MELLPARAPSRRLYLAELLEVPGLLTAPVLPAVRIDPGQGEPVIVLPGFLASDLSTIRLRRSLRAAGYVAEGWGLGLNLGARAALIERLADRVRALAVQSGQRVVLIGWSLGGIYAREVAKIAPEATRLVITLGSPFSGDLRANNAWRLYELVNDHAVDAPPFEADVAAKPPVRTIALWSARDGIIPPACVAGQPGERDAAVEVNCRHLGFAWARKGIAAIGRVLASELRSG